MSDLKSNYSAQGIQLFTGDVSVNEINTASIMENKPVKRRLIFDHCQNEIDNEQSQDNFPNDEKSVNASFKTGENKSTTNKNIKLNESNNCDTMLKAFDDAFETIYGDSEVNFNQVHQITEELQTNCVRLINTINNQTNSIEIDQLKLKYTLLENESLGTINGLQSQITKLNLQLKQQSAFSSIIGSIFGSYLWQATQLPSVAGMVLQKGKITRLAKLMTCIISSFIKLYNDQIPSVQTYETKFVLNILGIVANLTTTEDGCHFFTQTNDGVNIINLIVSIVICTPTSLDTNFKKVSYAVLYNVSIKLNGHLLMENNKLIRALQNDIIAKLNMDINDTFMFALKLLHSLTRNINESMHNILKNEIQLQEILKLTKLSKTELLARQIFENIHVANEKYKKHE